MNKYRLGVHFFFLQMIQQHQEWLEDLVIRLLCVFALDRFGDFVSDEVSCLSEEVDQQTSAGDDMAADSLHFLQCYCMCLL